MVEVKKKLGDMLKDAGIIDDFQLQTALSHQRSWGGNWARSLSNWISSRKNNWPG